MGRPRMPISSHGVINVTEVRPGLWRARTLYRFSDGRRRQVERLREGRTAARAVVALQEALVELGTPSSGDVRASTRLSVLGERFLAARRGAGLAPRSLDAYERTIRSIIRPRIGDLAIAESTPARLQAVLHAVSAEHGPGAAKVTRTVLSGMFGLAVQADALRANPVASVGRLRLGPQRGSRAVPLERVPHFLSVVADDDELRRLDMADLLAFMLFTGCRIGEAVGLAWDDIDFEKGTVTFHATVVRVVGQGLLRQTHGKTAASTRTIDVPEEVLQLLRARERRSEVVFCSLRGGLRDPSDTENRWRVNRERLGFPDVTSHSLRKTAATALDVAGLSARAIAEYLGHAKPSITQDVYMSRNVGSARAAKELQRMFGVSSDWAPPVES